MFESYIEKCAAHVRAVRSSYYSGAKLETVIKMSLPFELRPSHPTKKGMLLSHGFLTSPYIMRSMAEDFVKQGFLVRAVLLPGHGTHESELNHCTWEDWLASLRFGYQSLAAECEEVYLCGFSIGATLSLLLSLELVAADASVCKQLKKIILLAPCFGISPFAATLPWLEKLKLSKFLPELFCTQAEKEHLGSYTQFSSKSVAQIVLMLRSFHKKLQQFSEHYALPPCYVCASYDDATVKFKPILNFAERYLDRNSCLRIYANKALVLPKNLQARLIVPTKLQNNIVSISHVAVPVAPNDAYFGSNGSYYGALAEQTRFGEPTLWQHKNMKRLTFNPDYSELCHDLFNWLSAVVRAVAP